MPKTKNKAVLEIMQDVVKADAQRVHAKHLKSVPFVSNCYTAEDRASVNKFLNEVQDSWEANELVAIEARFEYYGGDPMDLPWNKDGDS